MNYEEIPIQNFVSSKFSTPSVQKIIESWRVEPQLVIDKVVEYFREMGIYKVGFNQDRMLMNNMLTLLKNSPEIMRMVNKARNDELKRQRNRHAE